jgi:glycosyltransferase involved in cell wall biosynthesis
VLAQSFEGYELIIVDDGSTDDTKKVCEPYLVDSRVHYIFQQNGGPAKARNTGISASSGAFICFLDDDDLWKPNKLQRQVQFIDNQLANFRNWGMVFTWAALIDDRGDIIGYRGHRQEGAIYKSLFFENIIDATSSVLVKREVFDTAGLFDGSLEPCEDWDMWLRISKEYLVFPIKEYLVQYREHENRLSTNNQEVFFYENAVLRKALASAPSDIKPKAVYASCYYNGSRALFASEDYSQCRKFFFMGARLSLRALKIKHVCFLLMSFLGTPTIRYLKRIRRYVTCMIRRGK